MKPPANRHPQGSAPAQDATLFVDHPGPSRRKRTPTGRIRSRLLALAAVVALCPLAPSADAEAATPSFSCRRAGSAAERLICNDEALAALDRKMAEVYGAAAKTPSHHADLNSGQRGFTRARSDCWQATDFRGCIEQLYVHRIAELQVSYRLVPAKGPFRYVCDVDHADELKAEFFATEPPSVALDYIGESLVALQKQPKGPARYETHNVSFREQNGEAFVAWGKGAKEMRCTVQK